MLRLLLMYFIMVYMQASIIQTISEKYYGDIGSFPTNFFRETVFKFKNDRPTIGIVAMQLDGIKILVENPESLFKDYFGASFVKLVESAGGRAVPIKEDISNLELKRLLKKINGVIIPGGDGDTGDSGYAKISRTIIRHSKKQALKGIIFPVLGICRGSQMIMLDQTEEDILIETDATNISLPLHFTDEIQHSRLFGHAPSGLLKAFSSLPLGFHAHVYGIPTRLVRKDKDLHKEFRILSTNYDRKGLEFISTFEGRNAPLYGLQWHPEKSLCIFNPGLAIDHSIYAITAAQYIANIFISDAKQNSNRFLDRKDEEESLIYRHKTTYVGNITETPYEQVYLFEFVNPFVMNDIMHHRRTKNTKDKTSEDT